MVKWLVDVQISSRQHMQHVFDGNDVLLFSSKKPSAVFEWLAENEERIVHLITEDGEWWLSLAREPDMATT